MRGVRSMSDGVGGGEVNMCQPGRSYGISINREGPCGPTKGIREGSMTGQGVATEASGMYQGCATGGAMGPGRVESTLGVWIAKSPGDSVRHKGSGDPPAGRGVVKVSQRWCRVRGGVQEGTQVCVRVEFS